MSRFLDRPRDSIRRLMIAMRIVTPGHEHGFTANVDHTADDRVDRAPGAWTFARSKSIRQSQENEIAVGVKAELAGGLSRLLLSHSSQDVSWMRLAARMRACAVGDDDDTYRPPFRARLGDQSSASQAFVVGMGRDDDQTTASETLVQRREGKGMRRLEELARSQDSARDGIGSRRRALALPLRGFPLR